MILIFLVFNTILYRNYSKILDQEDDFHPIHSWDRALAASLHSGLLPWKGSHNIRQLCLLRDRFPNHGVDILHTIAETIQYQKNVPRHRGTFRISSDRHAWYSQISHRQNPHNTDYFSFIQPEFPAVISLSSTTASGHMRRASRIGMAEYMPNLRAS